MRAKHAGLFGFCALCAGCLDCNEDATGRTTHASGGSGATVGDGSWATGGGGGSDASSDGSVVATGGAAGTSAAPALDTSTKAFVNASGTAQLAWQHTIADHPNRMLIVSVHTYNVQTVTAVSFGAAPLTYLSSDSNTTGGFVRTYFYSLANPPVGVDSVTIALNLPQFFPEVIGAATSFYNVSTSVGT